MRINIGGQRTLICGATAARISTDHPLRGRSLSALRLKQQRKAGRTDEKLIAVTTAAMYPNKGYLGELLRLYVERNFHDAGNFHDA
jgi:hypothetical protein